MEKQSITICGYPWNAAAIRPDSQVVPCCAFSGNLNTKINQFNIRDTDSWKELRKNMLSGIQDDRCRSCWNNEYQGITSLRQYGSKKFPIPINDDADNLTMLEVAFSNLCNLACVHCSSYFSTRWQTEDIKHDRSNKRGIIKITENNLEDWNLENVRYLKIVGGEPFLEQKKFVDLLNRINLSECSIQICTNGTQKIDHKLVKLLKSAKAVLIALSMDGTGMINDWCRWPSKWEEQERNIDLYSNLFRGSENIYLHFHHCISIYNIFRLKDTIDYVQNRWPRWKIQWDWVDNPEWQCISVFPEKIKTELKKQLSKYASELDNKDLSNLCNVNPFADSIKKIEAKSNLTWKDCLEKTEQLASERQFQNDVREFFNLSKRLQNRSRVGS
jgi:hypothetical protein